MTAAEPDDDRSDDSGDESVDADGRSAAADRTTDGDGRGASPDDDPATDTESTPPDANGRTGDDGTSTGEGQPAGESIDDPTSGDVHPAIELREHVRSDRRDHWIAMGIAVVVGLAFTWLHWFGLVIGGAMVGLVTTTWQRAPLAGLGFGGIVLAVFTAWLGGVAAVTALQMTPVTYVLVGASIGLPVFGSLVRWLE